MIAIGQKLRALFSLDVSCFAGHNHKSDYSLLCKQYKEFRLQPKDKQLLSRMDDVRLMALNRGLTTRGKEKTTLKALCRDQKMYLKKPKHVRVGTCFNSKGTLSEEAKLYCQMDVEAPLLLHGIYSGFPDLTKRIRNEPVQIGSIVDIMPESGDAIHPIAQGIVKQVGGEWRPSAKLSKKQVLVQVQKVFDGEGVIHYPSDNTDLRKCACGQKTHTTVVPQCNFYMFSQLGTPPFKVIEYKTRLRPYNELIQYPPCIYSSPQQVQENSSNFNQDTLAEPTEYEEVSDDQSVCESDIDDRDVEEHLPSLPQKLFEEVDEDDECSDDECNWYEGEVEPTPNQVRIATAEGFEEVLQKLIADADALAEQDGNAREADEDDSLAPEDLHRNTAIKKVLGDAFHFMDRAKVPTHHEYKALYFRALRAAMFIMNESDVEDVKKVLSNKRDESWEKKMAFNFTYIAQRVRRRIPPPNILYHRMKAVYDFFKDRDDSKKNTKLFNDRARKKFENVLELVKQGYASDPEHMSMYIPKTDSFGRVMVDKDGLQLYRSIRGTSNLESLHQYLTTSFGHTIAGPWYSDMLLTIVKHFYNWRMSRKNRPGFPPISHYNGLLLDRINNLYEIIYGHVKYRSWKSFNENLPLKAVYGVVAVEESLTSDIVCSDADKADIKKNTVLKYLAHRQGCAVPFLPVRFEAEKKLAHRKLREAVANNESLSNMSLYQRICTDWNTHHVSVSSKVFPKLPIHFAKYVKGWQRNQNCRDAEISSGAHRLNQVLEHVPPANGKNGTDSKFQPDPLNLNSTDDENFATKSNPAESNLRTLTMIAIAAETQLCLPVQEEYPKIPKRRRCQVPRCINPYDCPGSQARDNCLTVTGGDPTRKKKRKIKKKYTKKCAVCRVQGCRGVNGRRKCPLTQNDI